MIPSIIIKYFFIVIGVLYLFKIGKEFMTKKYNYENLINDINNLDLVAHRHSLVIIKNKDKYLLFTMMKDGNVNYLSITKLKMKIMKLL